MPTEAGEAHIVWHEHGAALTVRSKVAEGVKVLCDKHHLHHLPAANVLHAVIKVPDGFAQPVDDRLQPHSWCEVLAS